MAKTVICPKCNVHMKPTSYGMRMPDPEEDDKFYDMGCLIDIPMASFGCPNCHHLIYDDVKGE